MELLSISSPAVPCLKPKESKHFIHNKAGVLCSISHLSPNLGISCQDRINADNPYRKCRRKLFSPVKALSKNSALDVATDADVGLGDYSKTSDELAKVRVPEIPGQSDGNPAAPVSSCVWEWKPKLSVHYEKAGMENVSAPAVLFLPGFGVGSFHYEKQLKDLGRDYRVWAIDFVGQGMSLLSEDPCPSNSTEGLENSGLWGFGEEPAPWAKELVFSADLWKQQIQHFVEQVIGEPVYIVGNSLGGFMAMNVAACNPELIKGVTLLNATPFWGFLPNPTKSPWLAKLFPWAGRYPLPPAVRKFMVLIWQKFSDPITLREILKQVYADHTTKVDKVFSRIIEITEHPAAAASFATIMLAPRGELSFEEALSRCQMQGIPICLMYGKEDPWVGPIWGLKIKTQIPEAPYYEITPAGHCPHDEVPEVVNYLLRGWIENVETKGSATLPLLGESESSQSGVSKEVEFVRESSKKSVRVNYYGSNFSLWSHLFSFTKTSLSSMISSLSLLGLKTN